MNIRVCGIEQESIVDGPGLRFVVFVQGCPHQCPGCHNQKSHAFDGGKELEVEDIMWDITQNGLLDGLTLSGGEPFCQAEACAKLARKARHWGLDVWCYTGYTWEELLAENNPARMALLQLVDVLVDGRFMVAEKSLELRFKGSKNQRIIAVQASLEKGVIVSWEDEGQTRRC